MSFSKTKQIRIIALSWLLLLMAYIYGVSSATLNLWPYPQLQEVMEFIVGHPEESTTLKQKVLNDSGLLPARHLVKPATRAYPEKNYQQVKGLPLHKRRKKPLVYLDADAPRGYRLIYGVFHFDDKTHGAILLGPDGNIKKFWKISQDDVPWLHQADTNIFPHGFEIINDGSILVAYDGGTSLTKYDYCGRVVWQIPGGFHHSIDLHDQDSFWVVGDTKLNSQDGTQLMHMSTEDGSVLSRVTIYDIEKNNREIDILGIRQIDKGEYSLWAGDPFHQNDIDPLPAGVAKQYPQFREKDLLISLRSLNLIFVIDPETLKIKWWRQGLTRRQHDPDWNMRGTITIFNNNMHREYSNIIELDPQTMNSKVLVDGSKYDFYSWMRGKHQILPNGNVLVTSTQQGRAFEVDEDGKVVFDFHNIYDEELGALVISEARYLELDYFKELPQCGE